MASRRRAKPVEVEAIEVTLDDLPAITEFVGSRMRTKLTQGSPPYGVELHNPVEFGRRVALWGDWLVRDAEGDIHAVPGDIFHRTYEPIEEGL